MSGDIPIVEQKFKLAGAVAVVTGGGSGIGRSISLLAAQRGAKVVVADLLPERAQAVAAEIMAAGGQALGVACDVSRLDSVQALADCTLRHFGAVNLVCSNAGVCMGSTIEATEPQDARWMFDINVFGVYYGIQVFAPLLRQAAQRSELAWILNTGSENSLGTPPMGPTGIYNATKHAVLALSDNARIDLAGSGVGVSILCPALVRTDLLDSRAHRTEQYGGAAPLPPHRLERANAFMATKGHDPQQTALVALDGVETGAFIIVPHPEVRPFVESRISAIQTALDLADARSKGHG